MSDTTEPAERVLVVEDDRGLRKLLADEVRDIGLEAHAVRTAEEAVEVLDALQFSLIVSDLRLPGKTGMELLEHTRLLPAPRPAFIVITAFGSISQAVEALKEGADDFLTKPLDLDHLRLRVQRLLDVERLKREVTRHRLERDGSFHGIVGRSRAMRALFENIRTVAKGRGPVTIIGESGVGKELVARALHRESSRGDGPFVPVNCAGIPENLVESELFGHESGSFTGAVRRREGLFAAASGGTILLDEVGELPLSMQAKLLRVLQEGQVRRVGSNDSVSIDVRVVVATHRDLEQDVADGRFREDLFYRLTTFILEVPPLYQRRGDVEALTAHFLDRFQAEAERDIDGFDTKVMEHLTSYRFPGNVRELENLVEHAVMFCRGRTITMDALPERVRQRVASAGASDQDVRQGPPPIPSYLRGEEILTLDELALRYVLHILDFTRGNKRRAASLLGISRQTLYRYLSRAPGLDDASGDDGPSRSSG